MLALIAVSQRVETKVGFFAGLGLFAAACSAGTDAYRLLSWLPGFDSLTPIRMRYLVAFSVVVLSAFGLEWILRYNAVRRTRSIASPMIIVIILGLAYIVARPSKMPDELARLTYLHFQELILALLLVFSTGLLGLAIVSTRWKGAAAAGICVLTLADLWFAGANYQRPISTSYYYPSTPGVEFMRKDSGLYRVLTTRRSHFDWQFKPNLPAMFGLNDVDGFDSVYLRRYVEFLQQIDLTGPPFPQTIDLGPSQFASPLVDLLNVKYAVSPDDVNAPGWQRVYDADLRVYQRTQPLPHVWIASQAQVMTDDAAILGTLARPDFDPRQTVIIEQTPAEPLGDATNVTAGDVSVTSYENNRLELMAQLSRPGWLVLSEIYYPGWLATIDGGPANLYQADYILRAVPVPAGQHRIILTFMPRSFVIGLLVSLASLMILAALALVTRRRTSSAPSKTTPA